MRLHLLLFSARRGAEISALVFGSLTCVSTLTAQADVIRGRVSSAADEAPLFNAVITATSISGGVVRTARTAATGRFTITFPNGDGDYMITVTAIGYVPRRFQLKRTVDQEILIADTRLTPAMSTLDTVVTVGQRDRPLRRDSIADIGGMDRMVNTNNVSIEQLGNLALMAATTPGLIFIPGVDGDPAGFSAFGLDPSQNNTTLNGMNSGATDLPRDGLYGVGVALSPYDVATGRFSGANLSIALASGGNYVRRLSSGVLNVPPLEWTDRTGRALGQEYVNANVGGGTSGPASLNKAFYNVSYQLGRRANDLRTLLNTDPFGMQTSGIAADSVTRLISILTDAQIPSTVAGFPGSRNSDQALILGGIDFLPPSSSSGQSFKLAFNAGVNKASPVSSFATTLPASAFDNTNWHGSIQAHHSGYFGFGFLSETGFALSRSRTYTSPYLSLPGGTVLINSEFEDGTSGVQSIAFGGALVDVNTAINSVELRNQLSWFSGNNKHRIKVTSEFRRDGYSSERTNNQFGTYVFKSLTDLENGVASSFSRQLNLFRANSSALLGSIAIGDAYRPTGDLQVVYGVRFDGNRFLDRPATNEDVERVFGVRNHRVPNRVYVSPRIGFSYTYRTAAEVGAFAGAAASPLVTVRGGIGVFQGAPGATLPLQAMANTGLPAGVQQISCNGIATPVPDWNGYRTNPSSIPDECADGTSGTVFSSRSPNVTLFDREFGAPRSIRSNLQMARAILDNRMRATVGGVYSLNQQQPGFVDLNLDPTARFALSAEANRPVFVAPGSISSTSGSIASRDGRVSEDFNRVTSLRSNLSSTARQFQVMLTPNRASTHYTWGFNYTLNSVRDRTNGFVSTSGSPFEVSDARSSLDWRHQFQFNVGYNLFDIIRLNWFHTFLSGMPFTPMVAGDVNGDGYANDRAFIFDPANTADATLASGMTGLISSSSRGTRECLQNQLGQLAVRSSCEGPWTSTAALRIDFNPIRVRMPQRTMLSLSVSNPLAGLDLLLHGTSGAHGWGNAALPDNRLLFVRGFDQASQRFRYDINPRFGNASAAISALRNPVAVTLLMRVDLGPTRERQDLTRTLDRGRTSAGTKVTAGELRSAYSGAGLINPLQTILRSADTLKLTGEQADSIATMNRWYQVRIDSIWSPVVREYAALPNKFSHSAAYQRYSKAREASVDLLIALAPSLNRLLTPSQIRRLPALTSSHLDVRYLKAVRSRTPGISAPVFPPPAGVASEMGRGRGGGP